MSRHLLLVKGPGSLAHSLARDHASVLRAVAGRLSKNPPAADDLVQDTLERALKAIDTFVPGTNERAWLLSILHNLFIDRCRRLVREGTAVQVETVELPVAIAELEPRWAHVTPEQVAAAVHQLEPGFRDAYRLHAAGRSYDEIAIALDIPRATVGTRLLRARRKLRSLLFSEAEDG